MANEYRVKFPQAMGEALEGFAGDRSLTPQDVIRWAVGQLLSKHSAYRTGTRGRGFAQRAYGNEEEATGVDGV